MKPRRTRLFQILLALLCAAGMLATALITSRSGLSDSVASTLILAWLVPSMWTISPGRSPHEAWSCLRARLGLRRSD